MLKDYYPYLMQYQWTPETFGDRSYNVDKRDGYMLRRERGNVLAKGFNQDKDTYVGSIIKVLWAKPEKAVEIYE
jgi:hypothetical protein